MRFPTILLLLHSLCFIAINAPGDSNTLEGKYDSVAPRNPARQDHVDVSETPISVKDPSVGNDAKASDGKSSDTDTSDEGLTKDGRTKKEGDAPAKESEAAAAAGPAKSPEFGALSGITGAAPDLVLVTPHGRTLWHPGEDAKTRALVGGGSAGDEWLDSEIGLIPLSKVIRARITDKKRLVAFRRFWWHKLRQMNIEKDLVVTARSDDERVDYLLLQATRCLCNLCCCLECCFTGCLVGVWLPLLLGMIVSLLFLLPLRIDGIIDGPYSAILSPVIASQAFVFFVGSVYSVVRLVFWAGRACGCTTIGGIHRKLYRRAAHQHRIAANRIALAELADVPSNLVDKLAPAATELTRWQIAAFRVDLVLVGQFVEMGLSTSLCLAIFKLDQLGALQSWSWSQVTAPAIATLSFRIVMAFGTWLLLHVSGPKLDAHAEGLLSGRQLDIWDGYYCLLLTFLPMLAARLDSPPDEAVITWQVAFIPIWFILIIYLWCWGSIWLMSKGAMRGRPCSLLAYYAWAVSIIVFAAFICATLQGTLDLSAAKIWAPLWAALPLNIPVTRAFLRAFP